ncbi:hypothetical protein ACQ4PT_001322 [Festuca glaucescens]
MEGAKARFIRWRVRAMERHVAELDFRPGGIPSVLQIVMIDVGQLMVYSSSVLEDCSGTDEGYRRRHFRQLHERERNKKLGRLRSLKGKKRQKFHERYISGNTKYQDAARELLTPKAGYGLDSELRRVGVHVRTVPDKPQAADQALKRQVKHAIACGVDCVSRPPIAISLNFPVPHRTLGVMEA